MSETKQVFMCYSRKDSALVYLLYSYLKARNFNIWVDVEGIEGGENFNNVIGQAIRDCAVFMPILTKNFVASDYAQREYEYAINTLKRPIIPVQYEDCEVPFLMVSIEIIDFRPRVGTDVAQQLRRLETALQRYPVIEPPSPQPTPAPALTTSPSEAIFQTLTQYYTQATHYKQVVEIEDVLVYLSEHNILDPKHALKLSRFIAAHHKALNADNKT